jgi:hypothetical protein
MCFYHEEIDPSMKLVSVERGCMRRAECLVDAIGQGLFCDTHGDSCNYSDSAEDEGSSVTACGKAPDCAPGLCIKS